MTSLDDAATDLRRGARNLLLDCAGLAPGERLLLVHERPDLGWYDRGAADALADAARRIGAEVSMVEVDGPANAPSPSLAAAMARNDVTVFLARIGDQGRFDAVPAGQRRVMSYARTAAQLASAFGTTPYAATKALKEAVDDILLSARHIEITCPDGTAVSGTPPLAVPRADVTVRRFPLGVPQPVSARGFSGRVALRDYLTPTGSRVYEPACIPLEATVHAHFEAGRLDRLSGPAGVVALIEEHYEHVAGLFGIDRAVVHSWHAGFHPACGFSGRPADDPDLWSNSVFNSPRALHFHTCGDYAPGEICWLVPQPTVTVDGTALWQDGRLHAERFEPTARCLEVHPALQELFSSPPAPISA
ncbi:MAG: hypothetical protein GC150_16790 [Rhizobiales bacterium]|nr:hypothetical protein [Hyphomicrobiales bacterium]